MTKTLAKKKAHQPQVYFKTPFTQYFNLLTQIDKGKHDTKEFGSLLILGLVEEVGEMARAYLAKHGMKPSNIAAQKDEAYEQELGDIIVVILRLARVKKINLHECVMYSLNKILKRQTNPKK